MPCFAFINVFDSHYPSLVPRPCSLG
jgi:hypothetical protein